LLEQTVNLKIEEAYTNVKATLLKLNCKVQAEQPPTQITVKQGSLWGISPKAAKKTIKINFVSVDAETKVSFSSKLSSDWKNITFAGCALAGVLVGVCVWMATDISRFMVTRDRSFWSWLITSGANVNLQAGQTLVNLAWGLADFLFAVILLEIAIVIYDDAKIDTFAHQTLTQLK
jgi:hypothetical protein